MIVFITYISTHCYHVLESRGEPGIHHQTLKIQVQPIRNKTRTVSINQRKESLFCNFPGRPHIYKFGYCLKFRSLAQDGTENTHCLLVRFSCNNNVSSEITTLTADVL